MVDFKSLLSTPVDTLKAPVPLPAGTYHGSIKGFAFGESKEKKTPYVEFQITLISAGEDVPADELEGVDLSKKAMRNTFYITNDSAYRIKEFTDSCGIPSAGRSLAEVIQDTPNQPILVEIEQKMDPKDPTKAPFNNIKSMKGQP